MQNVESLYCTVPFDRCQTLSRLSTRVDKVHQKTVLLKISHDYVCTVSVKLQYAVDSVCNRRNWIIWIPAGWRRVSSHSLTMESLCAVKMVFMVGQSCHVVDCELSILRLPPVVKWTLGTTLEVPGFVVKVSERKWKGEERKRPNYWLLIYGWFMIITYAERMDFEKLHLLF